jgi:two-component system sensor histidine kinase AtoS
VKLKKADPYENIIENLGEGVICVDPSIVVTVFNQSAEKITGLSRAQVLKKPLGEVFTWLVEILEKTLREQKLFADYEKNLHRKFSAPVSVGVTTSQVFDPEGNLTGAVALVQDLSGIKSSYRTCLA